MWKTVAVAFVVLSMSVPAFAVKRGRVKYHGGTIDMKEGKEAPYRLGDQAFVITPKKKEGMETIIPWDAVQGITYGQPSGVQWVSFSKSKRHHVTLLWEGGAAMLEFDKKDINKVLMVFTSKTGVKVEYLQEGSK